MDNNKMRPHFNLFDALIILLVILAISAATMLRNRGTNTPAGPAHTNVPMRFTVELTAAPHGMADVMQVGCDVYRSTDNLYLGKLVDLVKKPHVENSYSQQTGEYTVYESEDTDDLYLTIENDGYVTPKEIVIGSLTARIGTEVPVKGKGFAKSGYIVGIDTMTADVPADDSVGAGELETVYQIRFADVRDFIADNYHVGDRLYEFVTGAQLGVIEDIRVEPYSVEQIGPDGSVVRPVRPERYMLTLTLRGRAVEKPDGYYLDGATELKIGAFDGSNSRYVVRSFQYDKLLSVEAAK